MPILAIISADTVEQWVLVGGPITIFGLLFACGLGLPLPEDIPLLVGGFFVAKGHMHLVTVSILAWCGIIGGDCVLYYLGRKYGMNITSVKFVGKHLTKERIVKAEQLFDRYGIWVVAVGRLFAGIRGAMVVAAGATKFHFLKFIIADGLAALVSGGLFIALGFYLGKKLDDIDAVRAKIKPYEHWVLMGIVLIVVCVVGYIMWTRRHKTVAEVAVEKVIAKGDARERAKEEKAREGVNLQ